MVRYLYGVVGMGLSWVGLGWVLVVLDEIGLGGVSGCGWWWFCLVLLDGFGSVLIWFRLV